MKKLIIVTCMIILASCSTVKQKSLPQEDSQDHLILATLWYQKSAEMRALYYQCFRSAEIALAENLARAGSIGAVPEATQTGAVPDAAHSGAVKETARIGAVKDVAHTGAVKDTARNGAVPDAARNGAVQDVAHTGAVKDTALFEKQTRPVQPKPAAVVLDIDETLLDNSPFQGWQIQENRAFNNEDWIRCVELAQADPLPGAVEFTRFADSLGVEVFYVSNRTVQEMGPTIRNMSALGFVNADSTHLLLKDNTSSKVARRAMIEKDYEIILLVGDNLADHSELYEKRGPDHGFSAVDADRRLFGTRYIVLPNPMYGSWLSELLKTAPGRTEREMMMNLLESF